MNKRLYVGNLSYATTDQELRAWFEEVGPVNEATVVMDRATGRSKGFGFVEMENDADAGAAIEKYNQTEFGGRTITVAEAHPRRERSSFGGGGYGGSRNERW